MLKYNVFYITNIILSRALLYTDSSTNTSASIELKKKTTNIRISMSNSFYALDFTMKQPVYSLQC